MYSGFYFHYEFITSMFLRKYQEFLLNKTATEVKVAPIPNCILLYIYSGNICFILCRTHNVTNAAGTLPKESQPVIDQLILFFYDAQNATHFSEGGI
jgi:hypothetical protein